MILSPSPLSGQALFHPNNFDLHRTTLGILDLVRHLPLRSVGDFTRGPHISGGCSFDHAERNLVCHVIDHSLCLLQALSTEQFLVGCAQTRSTLRNSSRVSASARNELVFLQVCQATRVGPTPIFSLLLSDSRRLYAVPFS